jgi:hypothetical protein
MQTDNTLGLLDSQFITLEQNKLDKAGFTTKPKETLTTTESLQFNGCILALDDNSTITLRQKEQGKKIQLINNNTTDFRQSYVKQRAREAYIASICQPEATFDLLVTAQHQEPAESDVIVLNKRLD